MMSKRQFRNIMTEWDNMCGRGLRRHRQSKSEIPLGRA